MKVLLSIKPEFALKIFNGSKKYEYRKTIFQRQDIDRVVIYVSRPIKLVIGEFEIEEILHDDIDILWRKTEANAGISEDLFFEYFADKIRGYAIKIKAIRMYDIPLQLNHLMISSPPQSFCYLDEADGTVTPCNNMIESSFGCR